MMTVIFGRTNHQVPLNARRENYQGPFNPLIGPFEQLMLDNQYKVQKEVEEFFIRNDQKKRIEETEASLFHKVQKEVKGFFIRNDQKKCLNGEQGALSPRDLADLAAATGLKAGQSGVRLAFATGGPEARTLRSMNVLA